MLLHFQVLTCLTFVCIGVEMHFFKNAEKNEEKKSLNTVHENAES